MIGQLPPSEHRSTTVCLVSPPEGRMLCLDAGEDLVSRMSFHPGHPVLECTQSLPVVFLFLKILNYLINSISPDMEMVWPCSCLHTRHSEHDCDWSVNILLICDW